MSCPIETMCIVKPVSTWQPRVKTLSDKRDQNSHINWPVRTARAAVQHHNAALHNTQRQFCYSTLASRPTSHLGCGCKEVGKGGSFSLLNIIKYFHSGSLWVATSQKKTLSHCASNTLHHKQERTTQNWQNNWDLIQTPSTTSWAISIPSGLIYIIIVYRHIPSSHTL